VNFKKTCITLAGLSASTGITFALIGFLSGAPAWSADVQANSNSSLMIQTDPTAHLNSMPCRDRLSTVSRELYEFLPRSFQTGCSSDSDCVLLDAKLSCFRMCAPAVMKNREDQAKAQLNKVDAVSCSALRACGNPWVDCLPRKAVCVSNVCLSKIDPSYVEPR
jgi:hypothetical protein